MKRILFICSGNMYRSAGAEFILRKIFAEAGIDDWIVDSAGTLQLNRTGRPEDFWRILAEKGYEFGGSQVDICKASPSPTSALRSMSPRPSRSLGDEAVPPTRKWKIKNYRYTKLKNSEI